MANAKKLYFVMVFDSESYNKVSYVTKIEGKTAFWEKGKHAKPFTKSTAEDLVFGLCMNLIPSAVVQAYDFITPFNAEGDTNERK